MKQSQRRDDGLFQPVVVADRQNRQTLRQWACGPIQSARDLVRALAASTGKSAGKPGFGKKPFAGGKKEFGPRKFGGDKPGFKKPHRKGPSND